LDIFRVNTRILIYQRLKQGVMHFFSNATNTKAEGTRVVASRIDAWANGGANDICPAGFSVPTEAELTADTMSATTTDITGNAKAFSSFGCG
jgi:hypothetical protein